MTDGQEAWRYFVADGSVLRSPILGARPYVEAWEKRTTAPLCPICPTSPGPCGHCGFTVVLQAYEFAELVAQVERDEHFASRVLVAAQVKVRGPILPRHPIFWNNLRAPEWRVGDIELEHLHLHVRDKRCAAALEQHYGIPVTIHEHLTDLAEALESTARKARIRSRRSRQHHNANTQETSND